MTTPLQITEVPEHPPLWVRRPWLTRAALLAAVAAIIALAWSIPSEHTRRGLLLRHPVGIALIVAAVAFAAVGLAANLMRLILVLRYRPVPAPCDDALPMISVLVPAFNEGPLVRRTLESLAASNYPRHKLQLIAIDDGSRDDTWEHIRTAAAELDCVHALRCRRNRGKRWALYEGFRRGRGQVFVTVDSDCVVEPDTLRNLVAPIAADPRVGAVAGNVRVLNRDAGLIPLLLSVQFVFSFDYIRAAENEMGSVLCTPGALAAYRASAVRRILDAWLAQRWMGRECRIGEDRAMTNMILAQGYRVAFQSNAVVHTKVPVAYKGLTKMFTRWARSNVRESIAFARFAFDNATFRDDDEWRLLATRFNFVARTAGLLITPPLVVASLALAVAFPLTAGLHLLGATLGASAWTAAVCLVRGRRSDAVFAPLYSLFWMGALWWINPWAMATSHRGGWLTRGQGPAPRLRDRLAGVLAAPTRRLGREVYRTIARALPRAAAG